MNIFPFYFPVYLLEYVLNLIFNVKSRYHVLDFKLYFYCRMILQNIVYIHVYDYDITILIYKCFN